MIDYVTLLLVNMSAGYGLLAWFVLKGFDAADKRVWAGGFAVVGLVAMTFGGHLTVNWLLPGAYSSMYGEMSVLFGGVFLGAALCMSLGWDLTAVAGYGALAGAAAVLLGVRMIDLEMTQMPLLSGAGFILSGMGGVCALPVWLWFREHRMVRIAGMLAMLGAAAIWGFIGFLAYWGHAESFGEWVPVLMRGAEGPG